MQRVHMTKPIQAGRLRILRLLKSRLGAPLYTIFLCGTLAAFWPLVALSAQPSELTDTAPESLEEGYRLMYNLRFDAAHEEFVEWQNANPGDPMGPVSEAANWLFQEFERLGVLQAQFFDTDNAFKARAKLTPDPTVHERFNHALDRAESQARRRVAESDQDFSALFALALVSGLKADYAALIEKRNMAALRHTREASALARQLLAAAPDYYDGYLATGISNYIIGSMIAPVRWVLRLTGFAGDKRQGIEELRLAADKGRLLGPFARILLAIAHLREKEPSQARQLLVGLRNEFPSNPLFAQEIARIDSRSN
jgi:hypothetical protein